MRLAVVSDVHGNLTALEAVVEDLRRMRPDAVVHLGDLALSGSRPAEVVDLVRDEGWTGVVGNTDELLWRPEDLGRRIAQMPALAGWLRIMFEEFAPRTRDLLGDGRLAWLRDLPDEAKVDDVLLVHATVGNSWRAPMPDALDDALEAAYAGVSARTVVYGHIHRPFVRRVRDLLVVNAGSVGMPFDGDPRASYAVVEAGEAEIRRVPYDVEQEAEALARARYPRASWLADTRRRAAFTMPG